MQVLGVYDAGDSGNGARHRVVDRIVDRLSVAGRVGVVRYDATIADGATGGASTTDGGDVTYDLGADGDWTATGTGLSVPDALDDLAPGCDYAVVSGVRDLRHPTLVVDAEAADRVDEVAGEILETVRGPADLDLDQLVDALESTDPHETLGSLVARVERSPRADRAGAIATFTGRVRAKDAPDDPRTEHLEFEAYDDVARQRLEAIRADLEGRDGVYAVAMHHRTGVVRDGEDIVFVVVLAGHREEAFRTVSDGIDRLKDEVPLFKKEVTVDDEFWVHER